MGRKATIFIVAHPDYKFTILKLIKDLRTILLMTYYINMNGRVRYAIGPSKKLCTDI